MNERKKKRRCNITNDSVVNSLGITVNAQTPERNDNVVSQSDDRVVKPSQEDEIQLRWSNFCSLCVGLLFENGKGYLAFSIIAQPDTTKITANAVLERLNSNGTYTQVASWKDISKNATDLDWNTSYYVTRGYTYRLTVTATSYRNGVTETISGSKSMYCD